MAVNSERSCNADISEGLSDGSYKKVNPNRGGIVEPTTARVRTQFSDTYYGIHEAAVKQLPDGTEHRTPGYVDTPPWRLT